MTKTQCPLGEDCDLTTAWMAGAAKAQDQIKAQAAEIERLNTQCEGLFQAAINNGQALIIAEAKLAKAVEAAFYEGFCEGRDGGWVWGDPTPAWKKSDAFAELTGGKDE